MTRGLRPKGGGFRRWAFVLLSLSLLGLSFQSTAQSISEVVSPFSLSVNTTSNNKVVGLLPSEVRHAYGFDQIVNQGEGQTIGITILYDNPNIQNDIDVFSQTFGLPRCTASDCSWFEKKFYPNGVFPQTDSNCSASCLAVFQLESSLDVEWAHAIAPKAKIVLVETALPNQKVDPLLLAGIDAINLYGARVISMSWSVPEIQFSQARQHSLDQLLSASNVMFVAAAGDTGSYMCGPFASLCWPGTSPNATAVGGTKLHIDAHGNYVSEDAWKGPGTNAGLVAGGGGGLSLNEDVPSYQTAFNPFTKRGVPDVAYNANPNNGFPVYDTNLFQGSVGWFEIAGTSAGAPQWAGLFAIANSIRVANGRPTLSGSNPFLYSFGTGASYNNDYHDITAGTNTNGHCGPLCSATVGYDFVTGLGSPKAANLIDALANLP